MIKTCHYIEYNYNQKQLSNNIRVFFIKQLIIHNNYVCVRVQERDGYKKCSKVVLVLFSIKLKPKRKREFRLKFFCLNSKKT